jgi:hypothetical protein
MNKINIKNMVKIFVSTFLVALLFMSLLGAGLATAGVLKNISGSLSGFLPIVMSRSPAAVTSSEALIVFSSQATTNGDAGGRTGMNDICENEDPSSHFCSMEEIELAWLERGVRFETFTGAWLDSHQAGTLIKSYATGQDTVSHWGRNYNCGGWTSTVGWSMYIYEGGSALNWEGNDGTPIYCTEVHPVSCCK